MKFQNLRNTKRNEQSQENAYLRNKQTYTCGAKLLRNENRRQYAELTASNARVAEIVILEAKGAGLSRNHFSDERS